VRPAARGQGPERNAQGGADDEPGNRDPFLEATLALGPSVGARRLISI